MRNPGHKSSESSAEFFENDYWPMVNAIRGEFGLPLPQFLRCPMPRPTASGSFIWSGSDPQPGVNDTGDESNAG